ncbi:hypothetical protein BTI679_62910 (plasmid) [Bacillus wiedmannii]|nr:hypothetical protein BTI679_62910 [Bacillus wiedmannii]
MYYLEAHIRDLQKNIRVLYENTKKVFREQFEREHECKKKREISKYCEYDMEH